MKEAIQRDGAVETQNRTTREFNNPEWRNPSRGMVKINSEAAMRKNGCHLAVIARDDHGWILHIQTFKTTTNIFEMVELEVILKAMQIATFFA